MNLFVTGVITGVIGYIFFGKLLRRFMIRVSPITNLIVIAGIGLLIMLGGVIAFAEFMTQASRFPREISYAIMLIGVFSWPTLIVIIIIWQKASTEGYSTVQSYATDAIGPFVSLLTAFILGANHAFEISDPLFVNTFHLEIATLSFIFDFWGGILAGIIAVATQKSLERIFDR